jgi:HAD superfamily hydrolase (TIGR01509 family)
VEGARRAGFGLAIQIRHDFEHGENDSGATPDYVIEDMTDLIAILQTELDCPNLAPAASHPIRGILFDAGDILYYRPNRGRYFQSFLKELVLEISPNHAAQKEALSEQAYRGIISQEQLQEALLQIYGITQPEQVERGKQALKKDENNVEFFEGVQQTLISLKERGYLLGIVTDTANPIHAKLNWFERGGFGHIWDSVTSSMELGTRKPDPKIYQAALQQLGLTSDHAVFVGHKTCELDGARAVGMQTIAFNYDPDAHADYFIEKFSDLLDVPVIKTLP